MAKYFYLVPGHSRLVGARARGVCEIIAMGNKAAAAAALSPLTHPRNGLGGAGLLPPTEWRSSQPELSNHHNIPPEQQCKRKTAFKSAIIQNRVCTPFLLRF